MKLLTYILLILLPSAFMAMEPETSIEFAENIRPSSPLTIAHYRQTLALYVPQESHGNADSDVVTTDNNFVNELGESSSAWTQSQKNLPYECQSCTLTFKNKKQLRNHNKLHISYNCDQKNCYRSFSSQAGLDQHLAKTHKLKKSCEYKCDIANCNETFTTKEDLITHKAVHHNKKLIPYTATWTLKPAVIAIEPEINAEPSEKFTENNQFIKSSLTIDNYMQILDSHAELPQESKELADPETLPIIDKNFAPELDCIQLEKLQQHQCQLCPFHFKTKQELNNHTEQLHNTHKCNQENCGRSFSSEAGLNHHLTKIHKLTNANEYKCNIKDCNEIFTTKKDRIIHQTTKHNKKKLIPYTALWNLNSGSTSDFIPEKTPEFSYSPSSPAALMTTQKEKICFTCNYCDKQFKSAGTFHKHKKDNHSKFFTFICEHCDEKCETDASLKHHQNKKHNPEYFSKKCDFKLEKTATNPDAQSAKRQKTT